ncbi:hypothetical protein FPV67DRAFT_1510850, partial [Lyophyllum atratum]
MDAISRLVPRSFNAPVSLRVKVIDLSLSCDRTIRAIFGMSTVALFVIQGILVVRVFYMFEHSVIARAIIALTYGGAIVSSITTLILVLNGANLLTPLSALAEHVGCPVHPMSKFWHLYIPAFLVAHIAIYLHADTSLKLRGLTPALLIRRLHRDCRTDPKRLGHVNSIPLSRVNWRKGSRDGEYLVSGNEPVSYAAPSIRMYDS